MSWPELLFDTLTRRAMPETIAKMLLDDTASAARFLPAERHLLARAARARAPWYMSSMPEEFETVPDATHQIGAVLAVFGTDLPEGYVPRADHPGEITAWIDRCGQVLGGWQHGHDWKTDRLPHQTRLQCLPGGSLPRLAGHRAYNRRVRVLRNLHDKNTRMTARQQFRRLVLIGRSGFACDIPRNRYCADENAAAFIAYYIARKNKRRMFTLAGKENPFDDIAMMLLGRCERAIHCDWEMIAGVCPRPQILQRLTDTQRGALMGRWWTVMRDCSVQLAAAWPGDRDPAGRPADPIVFGPGQHQFRATMIVRHGMDSSAWNTMAQAYNAARAGWINCATLGDAAGLTEPFCPGKVMRLMAADLAGWHRATGGGVDPDTEVWAALPFPWDVINGLAGCTLTDVITACRAAGINPAAGGWTGPLAPGQLATWTPTPELVHGVTVADPQWAGLLRRAGVFSGKPLPDAKATEAAGLRTAAETAGVVTGPLPVYDTETGTYQGPSTTE